MKKSFCYLKARSGVKNKKLTFSNDHKVTRNNKYFKKHLLKKTKNLNKTIEEKNIDDNLSAKISEIGINCSSNMNMTQDWKIKKPLNLQLASSGNPQNNNPSGQDISNPIHFPV